MTLYEFPTMFSTQADLLFPALIHAAFSSHNDNTSTHHKSEHGRPVPTIEPTYSRYATSEETRVEIEIPGVSQKDVSLQLNDRMLVLSAKRYRPNRGGTGAAAEDKAEMESDKTSGEKDGEVVSEPALEYRLEMKLGSRLNSDGIWSEMKNGVLVIRVPVAEAAKPRTIQIGA